MTYIIPIKSEKNVSYNDSIYTVEYFNTLISTTAIDEINTEWDAVTTFAKDSYVKVSGLNRVYRLASATSIDEYPPANPSKWIDYGATNSNKMFDDIIGSQTKFTTTCTVVLEANRINAISLLNLKNISEIKITQHDVNLGIDVYEKTISLVDIGVLSLYDYWYKPVLFKRDLIIQNLYFSTNATISIEFTSADIGNIGAIVMGVSDEIGLTLVSTSIELKDYSKYIVDDYGNTSFSKRGYARVITGQVVSDTNLIDETITKLTNIRGSLTLFIGDETENGFASLTTLGYIESLSISISNLSKTQYPIKIIGVI